MSHTTMLWSESCVSALGITRVSRTEGQKGRLTRMDVVLGRPVPPPGGEPRGRVCIRVFEEGVGDLVHFKYICDATDAGLS